MRRALQIIGQSRSSQRIELAASQGMPIYTGLFPQSTTYYIAAVSNYDQALLYLSTSADIADEFVVTMYTLKVSRQPQPTSINWHSPAFLE